MATRKKRKKKSASSAPKRSSSTQEMLALRARVEQLLATAYELHELHRSYLTHPLAPAHTSLVAAAAQPVAITFKKQSGPANVRITLRDTQEVVLQPGSTQGTSAPRAIGAEIDAFIEVIGNPGELADIALTHALPRTIKMAAAPGQTGNRGTKPLRVI